MLDSASLPWAVLFLFLILTERKKNQGRKGRGRRKGRSMGGRKEGRVGDRERVKEAR